MTKILNFRTKWIQQIRLVDDELLNSQLKSVDSFFEEKEYSLASVSGLLTIIELSFMPQYAQTKELTLACTKHLRSLIFNVLDDFELGGILRIRSLEILEFLERTDFGQEFLGLCIERHEQYGSESSGSSLNIVSIK